jgi:hypothetical protein
LARIYEIGIPSGCGGNLAYQRGKDLGLDNFVIGPSRPQIIFFVWVRRRKAVDFLKHRMKKK